MVLVFVHGWNVRDTATYGELPQRLRQELGQPVEIEHVYLGRYVSFEDGVTLEDIARAFDFALREKLYDSANGTWRRFACITHSTGGPVVRFWQDLFYRGRCDCPLSHCITLAAPHFGSALAQLGRTRVSRLKFALEGVEPGEGVLNWLELGSAGSWDLNRRWLDEEQAAEGPWWFSLIGQSIDRRLYDHLNSYTGEPGSDGVVRVASANLNYQYLRLEHEGGHLRPVERRRSRPSALGVLPGLSHSGGKMGILTSVSMTNEHPVVKWISRCLSVNGTAEYETVSRDFERLTAQTQARERVEIEKKLCGTVRHLNPRHAMVVFRLRDNRGTLLNDFDLLLTAGPSYSPNELPPGFCRDRQRNRVQPAHLTYYLNHDALAAMAASKLEGRVGFRLDARPQRGLAYYETAEYRSAPGEVTALLRPNETLMVEMVLHRNVDARVFELDMAPGETGKVVRIDSRPSGRKAA